MTEENLTTIYKLENKLDNKVLSNIDKTYESFDDMDLKEKLLRGIYAYGFENPSEIQQCGIRQIINGKDLIAQAESGTGKTGAFSIGTLESIDQTLNKTQALILSPTRDLAIQNNDVIKNIGAYLDITTKTLIGGRSVRTDIEDLISNPKIISGTPGRILHMIQKRYLKLEKLKLFILDEADTMLDKGFIDQIYDIFKFVPESVQVCIFSATFPPDCLKITRRFMRNPAVTLLRKEQITLDGIQQFYIELENDDWKLDTLCDLYEHLIISQCIIFCNKLRTTQWLAEQMEKRDFTVSVIHSELNQDERDVIIKDFKAGKSRVLIATDLVARGIDVHGVSLVINYDLPKNKQNYIHRIGRSGRFGRKGLSINLNNKYDQKYQNVIKEYYKTQIEILPNNVNDLVKATLS